MKDNEKQFIIIGVVGFVAVLIASLFFGGYTAIILSVLFGLLSYAALNKEPRIFPWIFTIMAIERFCYWLIVYRYLVVAVTIFVTILILQITFWNALKKSSTFSTQKETKE